MLLRSKNTCKRKAHQLASNAEISSSRCLIGSDFSHFLATYKVNGVDPLPNQQKQAQSVQQASHKTPIYTIYLPTGKKNRR